MAKKRTPVKETPVLGIAEDSIDDRKPVRAIFARLKKSLPALEQLLGEMSDHWRFEDRIYRYYHQSFKVYSLQNSTETIVKQLTALRPGEPLNKQFMEIVADGTGRRFEMKHNREWSKQTRPIVEAFFHAKYFLEMLVRYGRTLEYPPNSLPSGWAAVLYLYDLR